MPGLWLEKQLLLIFSSGDSGVKNPGWSLDSGSVEVEDGDMMRLLLRGGDDGVLDPTRSEGLRHRDGLVEDREPIESLMAWARMSLEGSSWCCGTWLDFLNLLPTGLSGIVRAV